MAKKLKMVCEACGSDVVSREAHAEWDVTHQKWVLGAVSDQAFCHDCEAETQIDPKLANPADAEQPAIVARLTSWSFF